MLIRRSVNKDYDRVLESRVKFERLLCHFLLGFARCFDLFHALRSRRTPPPPVLQFDFFEDDAEALASDWRKILPPECFPS